MTIVWRTSNYATLDGAGGLKAAGRWHSKGRPILYCAPDPSTAVLELLAHLEIDLEDLPSRYKLLKVGIPDELGHERIDIGALPDLWRSQVGHTRQLGDAWLAEQRSPVLHVPSALVPQTNNVLINPAHPESSRITIIGEIEHPLDPRFFRKNGKPL